MNESEKLDKLFEELFPGRDKEYVRYGFCGECQEVLFIDPPGGPFEPLEVNCSRKDCKHIKDKSDVE